MIKEQGTLKRNIKLFEGIVFVIGFVIGSGIFLKPAVVLKNMGSTGGAISIWIIGGIITICAALSIAEIDHLRICFSSEAIPLKNKEVNNVKNNSG